MQTRNIKKQIYFAVIFSISIMFLANAQDNVKWQIYQLDDLNFKRSNDFLKTANIAANVETTGKNYMLKVSKYDRVVFVVEGKSSATNRKQKLLLNPRDVLFVKAYDTIRFHGELKLLTWTSKSTKINHHFKTQVFSENFITSKRDSSENVWNRFIQNSTMTTGLYMLPKSLNGDDTLNHTVDEINLVLNGTAKFKMNDTVIDVKPGSIMWVKNGVGHNFYDLSDDFDVYILFENH